MKTQIPCIFCNNICTNITTSINKKLILIFKPNYLDTSCSFKYKEEFELLNISFISYNHSNSIYQIHFYHKNEHLDINFKEINLDKLLSIIKINCLL